MSFNVAANMNLEVNGHMWGVSVSKGPNDSILLTLTVPAKSAGTLVSLLPRAFEQMCELITHEEKK